MSLKIVRLQKAREDIVEIAAWIMLDNTVAGDDFLSALEETLRMLSDQPMSGQIYKISDNLELRRFRVKRFGKYLLFYRAFDEHIELVRVLHGARDIPTLFDGE